MRSGCQATAIVQRGREGVRNGISKGSTAAAAGRVGVKWPNPTVPTTNPLPTLPPRLVPLVGISRCATQVRRRRRPL